jgi:protein-tyrosine phosphatase
MTCILVVCTGNVCRSPLAEGLLRAALRRRFGDASPEVASAGTAGWEGSEAMPGSVEAARELGVDISSHRARRLTRAMAEEADLLLCMATDHREAIGEALPALAPRAFTMKELVRLLETLPVGPAIGPDDLRSRVEAADHARAAGAVPHSWDDDITDPLGQPIEAFRAMGWEIDTWMDRLVGGLYGAAPAAAAAEGV